MKEITQELQAIDNVVSQWQGNRTDRAIVEQAWATILNRVNEGEFALQREAANEQAKKHTELSKTKK